MKTTPYSIHDANEAVASVAYRLSETIAIYPITPSSPMAELADEWSSQDRPNLWETVPQVTQMQSEGGVAGAIHGALQGGSLTTTFTASQGLLLPVIRGTAQNPDAFFQAREAVNRYYDALPEVVEDVMENFHKLTGRSYRLVDYAGAKDAEEAIVIMGSGAETAEATSDYLNREGRKTGVLKIRLYRPFPVKRLAEALPPTVKHVAVLDRTKEAGADALELNLYFQPSGERDNPLKIEEEAIERANYLKILQTWKP